MHILIAEDNSDNRDLLSRRLQRLGWEVELAADGVEAIEACNRSLPDLVLMDISMPRMNGLEATRQLRANPATAGVRIIAVTAHAMDASRVECIAAGCDDFATKPLDFPALVAKIRSMFGLSLEGVQQ